MKESLNNNGTRLREKSKEKKLDLGGFYCCVAVNVTLAVMGAQSVAITMT